LDALILSRVQFGFVIAFHILFPAFTIGLASYLAVLEGLWLATRREVFKTLYLFWLKIFALSFGMGVVSGVVLSYQIGTNWSEFSRQVGGVIGPLLGYEVMTAFFLEASFLGVMLFGWTKVGPRLHMLATGLVAFGTLISAFFILEANSWMQHPVGFARMVDGRYMATSFWTVLLNPAFPARFAHMVLAAYLTTALVVAAASAWRLLKIPAEPASRMALRMAVGMIAVVAPLQLLAGHVSGDVVRHLQPAKLAAIESYWKTQANQPLVLVALPDRATQSNHFELAIPGIGNLIQGAPSGEVIPGLDQNPVADQPPVYLVFWSFRLMVGLGLAMIGLGLLGAFLWWRGKLFESRLYLWAAVAMGPAGFAAVVLGWMTAEIGRQPWVAYGVLRTRDAVSPVGAGHVAFSLAAFLLVYAIVFTAGAIYILRLMGEGPEAGSHESEPPQPRAPGSPLAAAPRDVPSEAGR
jgi:cytochrome d ubiquinol oxidase subunit I